MKAATAPSLEKLERWMQTVVMHPEGTGAGLRSRQARRLMPTAAVDLDAVVRPSRQLTSGERLGIYAHMYAARLLEVLEGEYPTLRQVLGPRRFEAACRGFIAKHPSRSRLLNGLSARFPEYLAKTLPRTNRSGLAIDIARIERAMEDVFDAPVSTPLTAAEFATVGEASRLQVSPALVLLELHYPANGYMNALRRGERPRIPRPKATHVIVFRRGFQVLRREQEPEQFRLLRALVAGKPLAAAIRASIGRRVDDADRIASRLRRWFEEWAGAHLFVR